MISDKDLELYNNCYDSYGDWAKCYILCEYQDSVIGKLDYQYNYYENEIYIDMIEVSEDFRRNGIATKMLEFLRDEHPDVYVDWGYTTSDGTKLKESLTVTEENPEYRRIEKSIESLNEIYKQWCSKWDDDNFIENSTYEEKRRLDEKCDKVRDKLRELEDMLYETREYITVWK